MGGRDDPLTVLAIDPADIAANEIKARALTELGERQINATARNYYLTTAQYLSKGKGTEIVFTTEWP